LSLGDAAPTSVTISDAIIAGWTGRDAEAVEKHIRELEALGVKRPSATPIYYRVAASRITTESTIQVSGTASSGEVEFVLLQARGKLWVGVGSDHTDREVEAYDVTVSKQMCEKPIAPRFWDMAEVQPHWDRLTLKSYIEENGARTLYQEGCVTAMRDPADLIARYTGGRPLAEGSVMFCGTFAVKGGVRPSSTFDFELADPVLERSIAHHYVSQSLPKVS
jgi:hypothetical protein